MLIKLLKKPYIPFDYKTHERLICLEENLRRSSIRKWKLEEYENWLTQANLNVPVSKTLRIDLKIYSEMCDDVDYPKSAKILSIDEKQTHDAVEYLLGKAWVDSPLKPRLYSSTVRCILLAMELKQEISFEYHKLDTKNLDEYVVTEKVGIPIKLVPGADAGYFLLWEKDKKTNRSRLININMTRIFPNSVKFTEISSEDYDLKYGNQEPQIQHKQLIIKATDNPILLKRLENQFDGIHRSELGEAILDVPQHLDLMTRDVIKSNLYRTYFREQTQSENKRNDPIDLTTIIQSIQANDENYQKS